MQKKGLAWIKQAMNVSNNYEELNFDVPNLHLLMEFLYRTLPALQNTHFSRSGPFETHHKQVKRGMLNLAFFFSPQLFIKNLMSQ